VRHSCDLIPPNGHQEPERKRDPTDKDLIPPSGAPILKSHHADPSQHSCWAYGIDMIVAGIVQRSGIKVAFGMIREVYPPPIATVKLLEQK
jgi:hypothetical protein